MQKENFTDIDLETALTKISEKIALICKLFMKETGHPISSIQFKIDEHGSITVFTNVTLSGAVTILDKDLDS
jgi:hypothetical protein